jgi:hypothetical protein
MITPQGGKFNELPAAFLSLGVLGRFSAKNASRQALFMKCRNLLKNRHIWEYGGKNVACLVSPY